MEQKIKLGLLDFGIRKTDYSSTGKILDVMEYAEYADRLGFSRIWLTEHHNYSSSNAWSSPQMLLLLILNNTDQINVSVAGVLLNYYSSYEVALNLDVQVFKTPTGLLLLYRETPIFDRIKKPNVCII
ncbi:LLM class flavin-dependent oxidoreductase [Flammeovirga kamogawensis]|uniref:LLM class flavin-dependent oxidoreductase n=1 Tax=Flammeovirga kamogawensis TaxID=373891 RepID=A0ABX8H0Y1_9BACT|nr:LLM class flavin-dependent oxidoreductase [Flammeovirga kamogawensis]MBB6462252.1 hypothetical protein [Flammeovirga kamogawensis]QWG09348.1 LLM class flavin-dependent oxidoreductase [Flammeovirga kamogawensis]TRX64870.1 LLM class flavin-dependent oxidoreductase [Flammeovirga kamogawensis]